MSEPNESAASATISEDVQCLACGYNLRGLTAEGNCPECGGAVRATLEFLQKQPDLRAFRLLGRASAGLMVPLVLLLGHAGPILFVLLAGIMTVSQIIGSGRLMKSELAVMAAGRASFRWLPWLATGEIVTLAAIAYVSILMWPGRWPVEWLALPWIWLMLFGTAIFVAASIGTTTAIRIGYQRIALQFGHTRWLCKVGIAFGIGCGIIVTAITMSVDVGILSGFIVTAAPLTIAGGHGMVAFGQLAHVIDDENARPG
jgi:hypothetical protein